MTFQYCSDLHLEFPENAQYLSAHPIKPAGNVLLLAGDIVPFTKMQRHAAFFDYISDNFERTYWIPGNHEYYQSDLAERSGSFRENIRSNVYLVNNVTVQEGDVRIIFSTLWSHIGPRHEDSIRKFMADFRLIKYNGNPLTAADVNGQHHACRSFIEAELASKVGRTFVVTHHVPTFLNYPPKFKASPLNEGFATELLDMIEKSEAHYWLYGHHHQPVPEFIIGTTRMICNQLGYVRYHENDDFDSSAIVK